MKLYRLGENEIRIHLTGEDLEAYSITLDDFDYDSTKGRRVIWELFDRAREETGFDAASDRIFIQVYPGRHGGCELYITKLRTGERERIGSPLRKTEGLYRFSQLEALLSVCELLHSYGFCGESSAYADGNVYYLVLRSPADAPPPVAIEEYGDRIPQSGRLSYIEEYATPIAERDAVLRLAVLK